MSAVSEEHNKTNMILIMRWIWFKIRLFLRYLHISKEYEP